MAYDSLEFQGQKMRVLARSIDFPWKSNRMETGRKARRRCRMKSVFYTRSKEEYQALSEQLLGEIPDAQPYHVEQDGNFHFIDSDLAVITLDGALGMETMLEYSNRYPQAMIVWITDDKYFARMAIRRHIFDFIPRPLTEERFLETVRNAAARKKGLPEYRIQEQE